MTAAQKKVAANFKKALAYRKINGCTLKEAFAKIYNKKAAPIKKAAKKVKKLVKKAKDAYYEGYNEAAKKSNPLMVKKRKVGAVKTKKAASKKVARKKAAPKKVARKKVVLKKVARKKAAPKKVSSMHKDTKSHNVNIKVMSGVPKLKSEILSDLNKIFQKQKELEYGITVHTNYIKTPGRPKALKDNDRKLLKLYKLLLRENKAHSAQMKKLL